MLNTSPAPRNGYVFPYPATLPDSEKPKHSNHVTSRSSSTVMFRVISNSLSDREIMVKKFNGTLYAVTENAFNVKIPAHYQEEVIEWLDDCDRDFVGPW